MPSWEEQQRTNTLLKHPLAGAALLEGYTQGLTHWQIVRDSSLLARLIHEMEETQRAMNYDRAALELLYWMTIERSA